MWKIKIKNYFSILIFLGLLLSHLNLALAADQMTEDYSKSGVQDTITKYLCSPTDASRNQSSLGFGGNSAAGDLYLCINKLYRFALVLASAVGVFFIVLAGYLWMNAEGNQESVDKAKSILASTITALVILFMGYVLLRAINPDLIKFQPIQPPSVVGKLSRAEIIGLGGSEGTAVTTPGTPTRPDGTCQQSGKNLCQAGPATAAQCSANSCNQYDAAIRSAARSISISGINTVALIKAIMYKESACNVGAQSGVGSCGLMQLQPATADKFKTDCGVNANTQITCDWLKNPANATASICMGAKYLEALSKTICGTNVRQIAAGYNGGAGACNTSQDCASGKSCDGGSVKKWECLYDDSQHKVCNTGYNETRNYAPLVAGCYDYYSRNP